MKERVSRARERKFTNRLSKLAAVLVLALRFLAGDMASAADNPAVKKIEITSEWQGLAASLKTRFVIRSDKSTYRLGRNRVDPVLVDAFVEALRERSLQKLEGDNLGISPPWLKENADAAAKMVIFENTPQNQKDLFRPSFTDPGFVAKVLPSMFDCVVLDDWPRVRARVIFADGATLSAQTYNAYGMMLPWKVLSAGKTSETYNANISRALAALMPANATNRERLAEGSMVYWLAQAVMRKVRETDRRAKAPPK